MRTAPLRFIHRASLLALMMLGALATSHPARASAPDANTRRAILECTFEVLAQMPAGAGAPLVRVAGTAFCFGNGELATAAHVLDQVLGSRFSAPVIRDRAGRTYAIERILRYSTGDDFAVFTASGLPEMAARPHGAIANDSAEFAAGEARGKTLYLAWRRADGDIAFGNTRYRGRSTLANLGRDGWIQFGPAPGHGASGAALLDDAGRVVGLVNSRSSELADADGFAVPIQHVENASAEWAEITVRDPLRTLSMPSERNMPLIGGIPLPAPYARFEQHMIEVRKTYFAHTLPYSLSLSGGGAPLSDAQRQDLCAALGTGYCDDDRSDVTTPVRAETRGRGCTVAWNGVGAALVRCGTRREMTATRAGDDIRAQIAMASAGQAASQTPPAPCTSRDPLDSLMATDSFTDHTGSEWQTRAWAVRGCDWVVISMSRPVADGTLAFVRGAPSAYADAAAMQLKALTSIRCAGCGGGDSLEDAVLAEVRGVQSEVSR
jgi:hypothetical protein